jgi:sugar/nucleoside kinase (ribokinase family)
MLNFNKEKNKIIGFGAPLIDLLIKESDDFVYNICDQKGGMTLEDNDFIKNILKKTSQKPLIVPGGAACNTIIGIAKLGGSACFVGKRGSDEYGDIFESDLIKNSVNPILIKSKSSTGKVLSVITPDAERTMFTHLGASMEFAHNDITDNLFNDAAIVFLEAYLLSNPSSPVQAILKNAKKQGIVTGIDLASFQIVEGFIDFLKNSVLPDIDIIIANEDEAKALTGYTDEIKALSALSDYAASIAVLKVGKKGSYIACNNKIIKIAPCGSGNAVDTTGAGDLWAAGFFYGLLNNLPLEKCGELASACGYEVCQVIGANIHDQGWERIKKIL